MASLFRPYVAALTIAITVPLTAGHAANAPAPAVTVMPIQVKNVAPTYTYIGRVQAIQSVALIARVQAFVEQIDFQEGGMVKQGQLLFELQKGPF